ncbi:cation efflux pump [gut metagenome]|uniref:Cation efflux pump n=1 Tax=gut metagenome TaxID=749906 RepID=J9FXL9_9ZZZZ
MQRVKSCFRIALTFMFTFNFLFIMAMILLPETTAALFTDDPALIATVGRHMPLFLAGMTIFGLQRACQNMFVALGQAKISIFIAFLRKIILLIPLVMLLPRYLDVNGVFAAEAIADATAALCCTLLFAYYFPRIIRKNVRATA